MLGFEDIVKGIIVLVVLGVAISIPLNILLGGDSNIVKTMLGIGGNITELDTQIISEMRDLTQQHGVAASSMTSLTYSINALALGHYHNKWQDLPTPSLSNVKQVPSGLRAVSLNSDSIDENKRKMILAVVDCWRRYGDIGYENTLCNRIFINSGSTTIIRKGELRQYVEQNLNSLPAEHQDLAKDLFGIGPINTQEVHWRFTDQQTINKRLHNKMAVICGNDRDLAFKGILITDNWKKCDVEPSKLQYGYMVENFELPQQVGEGHSFYNPVSWLETHGDPKYLVYYESFPKGEDKQWEPFSWTTFALGVGIAVVAEGAGAGLVKLLKPAFALAKVGGKIMMKIPGVKALKELGEKALKEAFQAIFKRASQEGAEKTVRELVEEGLEKTTKKGLKSTKSFKGMGADLSEALAEDVSKETNKIIKLIQEYGDENFIKNGELTEGGTKYLKSELEKIYKIKLTNDLGKKAGSEIMEDITQTAIRTSKEGLDPKFIGKIFNARNGRRYLQDSFETAQKVLKEEGEEAAKQSLRKSLDQTYKILDKLSPQDLAKITRKNKQAARLIWKEGQGIDWTAFGGRPLSAMDDWSKMLSPALEQTKFSSKFLAGSSSFVGNHKKDWVILVGSMIAADYIMSKQAKYFNIGENAIGLKVPNEDVIIYGQRKGIWDNELLTINNFGEKKRDFLTNYGEQANTGILPEVSAYYLQLEKDKLDWWPDQEPVRFFLASPCKADVYITIDKCECYGNEKEDLEAPLYAKDFANGKFGANNLMMYEKRNEHDPVTKICNPNAWFDDDIGRPEYSPVCIKINPLIDTSYTNNFCYSGTHVAQEIAQKGLRAVQIVDGILALAGAVCTAVTGGACAAIAVPAWYYMALIAGGAQAGIQTIERTKAWPDHGDGT